ncbi:hypothetical protein N7491_006340 [Penicillium cf. griseofulvum]|uniref:Uncharacterized protein n=1 Tax=Penicillium cf. griseofulvum TaxID=2972120 RepID=A0A9W9IVF3_9EURO|nr:hypothetical protein N7472_010629 [Penicillium cf. griseofulvum]KAJ5429324.1 hypothetical protein N7491_006340 [Penicillium cf. griseofulvum]
MSWYPPWEEKGQSLRKWIDHHNEPGCPYPISTFAVTYSPQLQDYSVTHKVVRLHTTWDDSIYPPDLPGELNEIQIENRRGPLVGWEGRTGPGVVFLDWIRRSKRTTAPHISEFTKAAYKMDFPLRSLRYVFVTDIYDIDTIHRDLGIWTPPEREYDALLGTKIGTIIAAFLLCAWG